MDAGSVPSGGGPAVQGGFEAGLPTVVYSSRTHSQLAQVVRELRKTPYDTRAVVLASRTHLCLHPEVSKLSGAAANAQCSRLCREDKCRHGRAWQALQRDPTQLASMYQPIADIEDLLALGRGEVRGADGRDDGSVQGYGGTVERGWCRR